MSTLWNNDYKNTIKSILHARLKCKLMTVTRSKHPFQPIYKIGSDTLEIVNSYLGIIISRDLDWKPHIKSIVCKTSKLSGFIRRVVKSKDTEILVKLYCSLCRLILEYAAPVWCPRLRTHQENVERVQRRFTRSCLGLPMKSVFIKLYFLVLWYWLVWIKNN